MNLISDEQIRAYISEKKIVPKNFQPLLRDKKCGHFQSSNTFIGENGSTFTISVRQSKLNPLDFSVIFGVLVGGKTFRLARYNGEHGEHTNKITEEKINGCHIHRATKLYQENGWEEEGYAEITKKYSDWNGALKVLMYENNFQLEVDKQQRRLNG